MKLLLLIMIAFLVISAPAEAAKWELLYEDTTLLFYIDADSISAGPGGSKEAWDKFVFKKPECKVDPSISLSKCYDSVISYSRYFTNKSYCTIQGVFNFTDGTFRRVDYICKTNEFLPNSFGDIEWKRLYLSNKGAEPEIDP